MQMRAGEKLTSSCEKTLAACITDGHPGRIVESIDSGILAWVSGDVSQPVRIISAAEDSAFSSTRGREPSTLMLSATSESFEERCKGSSVLLASDKEFFRDLREHEARESNKNNRRSSDIAARTQHKPFQIAMRSATATFPEVEKQEASQASARNRQQQLRRRGFRIETHKRLNLTTQSLRFALTSKKIGSREAQIS